MGRRRDEPAESENRSTEIQQLMTLLADHRSPTHALERWTHHWARRAGCEGATEHQTLRLILEIRDVLIAEQRTQERYRALYATAHDLTRLRDVDHVLDAIVERARGLLDCDVAYLDTNDDHSEDTFTVRTWAGQLSPRFQGVPVTTGHGVGGTVAKTRRAFQVGDYMRSDAFPHSEELDAHMQEEGLLTLLGVPLEVDGRLIGILFAGRRRAAEFTAEDQDLLSSLAAHAAVALDNATLFHAQEATLARLEHANTLINEHNAALERDIDLHTRLTHTLLQDSNPQRIITEIAAALDVSITLTDPDHSTVLSSAGHDPPAPQLPPDCTSTEQHDQDPDTRASSATAGRHVATVHSGTRVLGHLLLATKHPLLPRDLLTFERSVQSVAVAMLTEITLVDADRRAAGELLRKLVTTPQPDPNTLASALRRHRMATGPMRVIVTELDPQHRSRILTDAEHLCADQGGLSAEFDGQLVVIVPAGGDDERVLTAFRRTLTGLTTAASGPVEHLGELPASYLEAHRCLQLMPAIGRQHTWATTAEFGMYSMLFTASAASGLDQFLRVHIGPLVDYDTRHKTQLCATALAYLDATSSPRTAAITLGVHANTIQQRLNRIDRLLDKTWRSGPRQLEVHTALRLKALHQRAG